MMSTLFTLSIQEYMPQQTVKTQIRCSQQFVDTSTGSKIILFRFKDKYGKELRCASTKRK